MARIDPALIVRCKMPRPCEALYLAMAQAGMNASTEAHGHEATVKLSEIDDFNQGVWLCAARAMYAVIAAEAVGQAWPETPQKATKLKGGTE